MRVKHLKKFAVLFGLTLSAVLLKKFCHSKTDGFAITKIRSSLAFNPSWETSPLPANQQEDLAKILDQPFYYLAKGAQSYVFASADGKFVIKFFRLYHLLPPTWVTSLAFPLPVMPYKIRKLIDKHQELAKDFQSYKIAFETMREETGLVFLHLNKTLQKDQLLTIYDKLGIAHQLDLSQMEFLVQKKATLVYPTISELMKTEGSDAAKQAITTLIELLASRCQKGIFDKDPDLNTNFGFLGKTAVQIDIGRFRMEEAQRSSNEHRQEIIRITDHFRQWLDSNYPDLSKHLLSEIQDIPM